MRQKKALILCSQDAFANAVKPRELKSHLLGLGYEVVIYDTSCLSRWSDKGIGRYLPSNNPGKFLLYSYDVFLTLSTFFGLKANMTANSLLLQKVLDLRGKIISHAFSVKDMYDLMICESNFDQAVMINKRIAKKQILDLPSPFAEELFYGKLLSKNAYEKFKKFEQTTYAKADKISFHWHTYAQFVKDTKYNGANFIDMSYGTAEKNNKTSFKSNPRIIFLGYLKGYWVNLDLLSKLCKKYPNIDVYGGPEPPVELGINYKGYAPTTDVIAEYQFGLVTITDDELRKHSFSSKHLEYVSYGLPVLTPAWRKDKLLHKSSIYYTVDNFLEQVHKSSTKKIWDALHFNALQDAKNFSWNNAFKDLDIYIQP